MSMSAIFISGLNVYPLKSARGIAVDTMTLDERGPRFDRRWMLIDEHGRFISQREEPKLSLISTAITDGVLTVEAPSRAAFVVPAADPASARVPATIWDDTVNALPIGASADAWFSDVLETSCRLVYFPDDTVRLADREFNPDHRHVGFADGFPLLVLGETSLTDLNQRMAERGHPALPMNRFRPNVVIDGAKPYAEDTWAAIQIAGEAGVQLSIVKPCARCSITTVDQATGIRGKEPLATLATYRRGPDGSALMGQNAIHDRDGIIRVGDPVRVMA